MSNAVRFDLLPTPVAGAADKVRARRARLSGAALAAADRQAAAWDAHLTAEIAAEDDGEDAS